MSSHHFVRAQQADCLIIVNQNIDVDLFCQILEWNPVIVATEDTLEWLLSLDIKIDYLISTNNKNEFPYPLEILHQTEIISNIKALEDQLHVAQFTIVGDKYLEEIANYILVNGKRNISILENNYKHIYLQKGGIYKKWMSAGTMCYCSTMSSIKIEGNVIKNENSFKVLKEETIKIHILKNIILKESI